MSVDDQPTFVPAAEIAAITCGVCSWCEADLCDVEVGQWKVELARDEAVPPLCDRCFGAGGHSGHGCSDDLYERGDG